MNKEKVVLVGDAMIPVELFQGARDRHLGFLGEDVVSATYEGDWDKLQYRRLEVEKHGPEIEEVADYVLENKDASVMLGLFVPVSKKVMDEMPNLRIAGVSRAGLENVNVEEATKKGVLVFNVMGRNAHAVSDYAVGMMLAESRNIAKAHNSIKNGEWQKVFANDGYIPEMHGKTIGLVGFGHIGHLVAKKLSGFDVKVKVYDPYGNKEAIEALGYELVELEELLKTSDYISLHARLSEENKGMIGREELELMKPTAYLVNTARAGLIDYDALAVALEERQIMGAALDVFITEPIEKDNPLLGLDNVTLTTHIAGTTTDALNNSPYLLMEDIEKLFKGEESRFIVNPEVLENEDWKNWFNSIEK